jgi:hypothetical protein
MKDKIQRLLDQIKRDFPDGCDGLECKDCPLLAGINDPRQGLCDAIQGLHNR